jgi:putative membrane protein insertion efficiency factor
VTGSPLSVPQASRAERPRGRARALVAMVRLYQAARMGRPSPCRFQPSCSAYAVEALQTFGAFRGTLLTARRLSRCHPWGGQGFDPVPDKKEPLRV